MSVMRAQLQGDGDPGSVAAALVRAIGVGRCPALAGAGSTIPPEGKGVFHERPSGLIPHMQAMVASIGNPALAVAGRRRAATGPRRECAGSGSPAPGRRNRRTAATHPTSRISRRVLAADKADPEPAGMRKLHSCRGRGPGSARAP